MVVARFIETRQQVGRTRPGGAGTDPKLASKLGLPRRGEGRAFLVAHPQP